MAKQQGQTTGHETPRDGKGFFGGRFQPAPVLVGIALDIGGTFLTSVLLSAIAYGYLASQGMTDQDEMAKLLNSDRWLVFWGCMGSFFTFLGGFVTAVRVRTARLRHALVMGIGSLIVGVLLELALPGQDVPLWYNILSILLVVPVACLGGWMGARSAQ
jgi:FtsH-binding integral membrane protein